MKPIGGYFEIADREEGVFIHKDGILLNTGRNALEWILLSLGKVDKVYIPSYTCDVVLEPLVRLEIPWSYYKIDKNLEVAEDISLKPNEYIVVNNYFGIKDSYIQQIAIKYGGQLIVDCAQAFLAKPLLGVKTCYSARKFVGVSDGGVAYGCNNDLSVLGEDDSSNHSQHLFIRKQYGAEAGFADYRKDEELLDNQVPKRMSSFTKDILNHIDYSVIVEKRQNNYSFLANELSQRNLLSLPPIDTFVAPMCYPFMMENGEELRKRLIERKVFVPKFWPNNRIPESRIDNLILSKSILPLPCDQRYGKEDMDRIIEIINI